MSNTFTRPALARRVLALLGVLLLVALLIGACGDAVTDGGTGQPTSSTMQPTSSTGRPTSNGSPVEIVISAASDLSPVLEELVPLFEKESGIVVKTNLGSTGQLAEQILAGAKVDVFLAASASAVDQLGEKGLLLADSARIYARGRLVLWTPAGSAVTVASLQDLTSPEVKRISLANPDHAPYGKAAREALQTAGLWDELQLKLVPAENVREAFQFASTGNVDVGLVALSLVIFAEGTYVPVPEDLHQPIDQTLAILASSAHQNEAQEFVDYLTGGEGWEILKKYGFLLPDGE